MKFPVSIWLCLAAMFSSSAASAETIKGQTVLASYLAPGQCAEAAGAGGLSAAVCSKTRAQDFHIEIFNDSARHVAWQKIMNDKTCLQSEYKPEKGNLYLERCSITTWSTPAFWRFLGFGHMRAENNYCPFRKDGNLSAGAPFVGDTCDFTRFPDLYPALLTRQAKVGAQTLASHKGQSVRAIIVENGYSGGNLVASEGALLQIDKSGSVSATNGGYIIAGGSGYILKGKFKSAPGDAVLISADYADKAPDDHSPANLDFFTEKHERGTLSYSPH